MKDCARRLAGENLSPKIRRDLHSPSLRGFLWSHIGWILSDRYTTTRVDLIHDFQRYPELRWLNKYHLIPPVALGVLLFLIGGWGLLV